MRLLIDCLHPCLKFFIFFLFFFQTACCSKKKKEEILRIQLSNEPISLDPTWVEDGVGLQLVHLLHQGLFGYDVQGRLEPHLVDTWSVSSDQKTYQFKLKEAFWSDGKPVKAEDFVSAFRRMLRVENTSKMASFFFGIQGASSFYAGKSSFLGVSAEGQNLKIRLDRIVPHFLHLLTLPSTFPQRQSILDAHEGRWPEKAPSTGQYHLHEHLLKQKIVLAKNTFTQSLWKMLEFQLIFDENTALNLFESGYLDILTHVPSLDLKRLQKKLLKAPYFSTYYLAFNCLKPPFQEVFWRKQVAQAIDSKAIVSLLDGSEKPASSFIPFGLVGHTPVSTRVPEKNFLFWKTPLRIIFDTSVRNSRVMEKVQQDLKSFLKLEVQLTHFDWKTYLAVLKSNRFFEEKKFDLFRFGWMAAFLDPLSHLKIFVSDDPNNFSGCSSKAYDTCVAQIEKLDNGPKREALIQRAQKILIEEEAMVIPIFHYVLTLALSERAEKTRINPFGIFFFNQ
jgi:oligopeptide transport system substrate-binding protein